MDVAVALIDVSVGAHGCLMLPMTLMNLSEYRELWNAGGVKYHCCQLLDRAKGRLLIDNWLFEISLEHDMILYHIETMSVLIYMLRCIRTDPEESDDINNSSSQTTH